MTENRKLCLRYRLVRHAKQRISTKISELAYSQILRQWNWKTMFAAIAKVLCGVSDFIGFVNYSVEYK